MFLLLSVTWPGLLKNIWFLSRMQLHFITQCLAKINVCGTCEWSKISVESLQNLNTKFALWLIWATVYRTPNHASKVYNSTERACVLTNSWPKDLTVTILYYNHSNPHTLPIVNSPSINKSQGNLFQTRNIEKYTQRSVQVLNSNLPHCGQTPGSRDSNSFSFE